MSLSHKKSELEERIAERDFRILEIARLGIVDRHACKMPRSPAPLCWQVYSSIHLHVASNASDLRDYIHRRMVQMLREGETGSGSA
jgi:hypothetical protein